MNEQQAMTGAIEVWNEAIKENKNEPWDEKRFWTNQYKTTIENPSDEFKDWYLEYWR